jgi:2-keto-3-deoxy-L-rhamnonate aldolase RhmA
MRLSITPGLVPGTDIGTLPRLIPGTPARDDGEANPRAAFERQSRPNAIAPPLSPARPGRKTGATQPEERAQMSDLRSILRNHMKEKLAAGKVVASMTVRLCRSIEIAQIAQTAGFDTLYVDMEHNTLSIDTVCQICIAAQAIGITPLVRVPANTPEYICRVLDGGAMGVIVPHVRSAAEAKAMVDLVKFPPLGHRSAGGALSQYKYRSFPIAETNAAMNDATTLCVMVETLAAVDNIDAIAGTPGVDLLLIGSNDLCGEMGIVGQYDHPRLEEAWAWAGWPRATI